MIFVDTGAWFASVVPTDPYHQAAAAWLSANTSPLITTDYIIDETLTLLRVRGERRRALLQGKDYFHSELAEIHKLSSADLVAAWEVFDGFADKNGSFTDCTSKVVIERLGITQAFAFDHHFSQFGNVAVVPS